MRQRLTMVGGSSGRWPVAVAALLAVGGLTACYPGEISNVSETQVVLTTYNEDFDFRGQRTYAIPDTVVEVCDVPNPPEQGPINCEDESRLEYDHALDATFVDQVVRNMDALGYQRIPTEEVTESNLPDVAVVVMVAVNEWTAYTYWPCGGYWGWWGWYPPGYGCWYPGYVSTTSWNEGTLFVDMLHPDGRDDTGEQIPSVWTGAVNAVLSSSGQSNVNLALSGIDRAFDQSRDYLMVQ
ncbi:MAG: DUF4136 domain-containing protein [Gemmatimonadota bacterium]